MKSIIYFLLFFIVACRADNQQNKSNEKTITSISEAEKRKIFEEKFATTGSDGWIGQDSLETFKYFMKSNYPELTARNIEDRDIYAFEENYIDPDKIDSTTCWFRILVNPCFRTPYCIVVENKNNKTYLTGKMTNGAGGYNSGTLSFVHTTILSDSVYKDVSAKLNAINFWNLKEWDGYSGYDGETWCFEAIEKGKYNMIYRWVPHHSKDSSIRILAKFGAELISKSKLPEVFPLHLTVNSDTTFQFP